MDYTLTREVLGFLRRDLCVIVVVMLVSRALVAVHPGAVSQRVCQANNPLIVHRCHLGQARDEIRFARQHMGCVLAATYREVVTCWRILLSTVVRPKLNTTIEDAETSGGVPVKEHTESAHKGVSDTQVSRMALIANTGLASVAAVMPQLARRHWR